jgi:hypothetical protein
MDASLLVTDRSGNVSSSGFRPNIPVVGPEAGGPVVAGVTVESRSIEGGEAVAVLVSGSASDPGGGWIRSVTVDGEPLALRALDGPRAVEFRAWIPAPTGDDVTLTVETLDGRLTSQALPVRRSEPVDRAAQLNVLLIGVGTREWDGLRERLVSLDEASRDGVRLSAVTTPRQAEIELDRLQNRMGPGDRAWVHIRGALESDPRESGPRIAIVETSSIRVEGLARLLRRVGGDAVLVTTDVVQGRSWRLPLDAVPGASPPAGCIDPSPERSGSVIGVDETTAERVLDGLAGAADADGDRDVSIEELLDFLGAAIPGLATPFRPGTHMISLGRGS